MSAVASHLSHRRPRCLQTTFTSLDVVALVCNFIVIPSLLKWTGSMLAPSSGQRSRVSSTEAPRSDPQASRCNIVWSCCRCWFCTQDCTTYIRGHGHAVLPDRFNGLQQHHKKLTWWRTTAEEGHTEVLQQSRLLVCYFSCQPQWDPHDDEIDNESLLVCY